MHGTERPLLSDKLLAARVRGSIDLAWIGVGFSGTTLQRLARTIAHYFRREDAARWYFFHNSFRLFLVARTAEGLDGTFDVKRDHAYHRELAQRCAQEPGESRLLWEEMYHRAAADDHAGVLDRATPTLFRTQIASLRPIDAVQADIRLALRTLAHPSQPNPVVLTRLVLAGAEAGRASYHLDGQLGTVSPARLLLQLGLSDEALEYARDGNRLRISPRAALDLCQPLVDLGRFAEAARLFELAEPLDLLSAAMVEDDGNGEKSETLVAWAGAAVLFLPIADIVERSSHIRVGPGRHGLVDDPDAMTAAIQARMLYHAGISVLNARRWNDLEIVMNALAAIQGIGTQLWYRLHVGAWRSAAADGDHDRARALITEALGTVVVAGLESGDTIALAQGVGSVLRDVQQAQALLDTVPQPPLATGPVPINAGFHPFEQRFALNRLRTTLGDRRLPEQIVPDAHDPLYQGIVYVERAVCAVAAVWGAAWRRELLDSASIVQMAVTVLHLFEDPAAERQRWSGWYIAEGARPQLSALLVHGAALHSAEARDAVLKAFEERWESQTLAAWPVDVRRHVIVAGHEAGAPAPWAERQLRALDALVGVGLSGVDLVDERQKQVEAWLDLGDPRAARAQLDALVVASFGLTPEDYQLSHWIAWLSSVNRADPDRAAERVSLCARALVVIKDGVVGKVVADGAEELLRAAFAWSPRHAVHLFYWCLDRGVTRQVGGVRALLRGVLDGGHVPANLVHAVLSAAVLAIDSFPDGTLARALAEIDVIGEGPGGMARVVDADVQLYARPVDRAEWRQGLARGLIARGIDLKRAGFAPGDLRAPEESRSSERLVLDDGTALDVDQVLARVTDLASLQGLLDSVPNDTSFNWTPIVAAVAPTLDRTGVSALIKRFDPGRRTAHILAVLSERLSILGDTGAAWTLGEQALDASDPHGWGRWYDGGSRSAAYRALVQADARRGRALAFQAFCSDLAADTYGWIGSFAPHLDEVLPIVADPLPYDDLWVEIERHLRVVTTPHGILPAGPPALDVPQPDDTSARALADVLVWHLGHPVQAVAQAAARAIGELLMAGNSDIVAEVDRALRRPDGDHMPILMVLDAVSLAHTDTTAPFADALNNLRVSGDYAERTVASNVSERLGRVVPSSVANVVATLPAVYRIALPPGGTGFYADGAVVPGQPRPDSDDPMQIVRPFDPWVEAIAEAATLPAINVAHRVVQIMHTLAPRDDWSAAGEWKVRHWLSEAGLRLTFRRPRSLIARRAIRRATSELIDAGMIGPDALRDVDRRLRSYDPALVLVRPATRPIEVGEIAGQGPYGVASVSWADSASEALDREQATAGDGRIILANLAALRIHDRPQAAERRTTVTVPAAATIAVPMLEHRFVTEYPTLGVDETPLPLLIRHEAAEYESPGTNWVALNPAVGEAFGWAVSDAGLFRWTDSDGLTMVESIWWVDGPPREAGTHGRAGETGTGWIILAAPAAWDRIIARYGPMRRELTVVRRVTGEDGRDDERQASRTLPAPDSG